MNGFCKLLLSVVGLLIAQGAMGQDKDNSLPDKENLTSITWAHACNSQHKLNAALADSGIMMIEADVILGTLVDEDGELVNGEVIPIMGHPPANTSDLSFAMALATIRENPKGTKLDFKSIEVFEAVVPYLEKEFPTINFDIWLNADILPGPGKDNVGVPVDMTRFLQGCDQFPQTKLSLGWTTKYGSEDTGDKYTGTQVSEMLKGIANHQNQNITFPVRAGIAANSLDELVTLVGSNASHTLTVWSGAGDYVNAKKLREVIVTVGCDRVYLDVPEEVSEQLNIGQCESSAGRLMGFGMLGMAVLAVSMALLSLRKL